MEKMCVCVRLGCFVQVACLKLLFFSFSLCKFKFLLEMRSASKIPLSGLLYQSGGFCVLCWELWPGIESLGSGSGEAGSWLPSPGDLWGHGGCQRLPTQGLQAAGLGGIRGQQPGFPERKRDKSLI